MSARFLGWTVSCGRLKPRRSIQAAANTNKYDSMGSHKKALRKQTWKQLWVFVSADQLCARHIVGGWWVVGGGWVGQSQSFTHITAHRGTGELFDKIVGLQRWSSRALLFTAHRCLQLDTGRHWDKMSGRVFLRCQVVGSQAASVEFNIQNTLSKLANTLLKYKIQRSNYKTHPPQIVFATLPLCLVVRQY